MRYIEFKALRGKAINEFPMFFAFNTEQFEEGKATLGVKENKELIDIGLGGFIRKIDGGAFHALLQKGNKQIKDFIKIKAQFKDALRYELGNHEYCITYDVTDTLEALGLELNKLTKDQLQTLAEAKQEYLEGCNNG